MRISLIYIILSTTSINVCNLISSPDAYAMPRSSARSSFPLHAAIQVGNISLLQTLIQSGVDVNAANSNGSTALMYAAEVQNLEILQILIQAGANIKANKIHLNVKLYRGDFTPEFARMIRSVLRKDHLNDEMKINMALKNQPTCPIGSDEFRVGDRVILLPCNHLFKADQIENWFVTSSTRCPVCREVTDEEREIEITIPGAHSNLTIPSALDALAIVGNTP